MIVLYPGEHYVCDGSGPGIVAETAAKMLLVNSMIQRVTCKTCCHPQLFETTHCDDIEQWPDVRHGCASEHEECVSPKGPVGRHGVCGRQ